MRKVSLNTHINWFSPGPFKGYFSFESNFYTIQKQTMETLIRRRIVWRLIRVCTVYVRPIKITLCLHVYGFNIVITAIVCGVVPKLRPEHFS